MKTICAMREVFKAMNHFEVAFEKVYQISLNEAIILCMLQETGHKVTASGVAKKPT